MNSHVVGIDIGGTKLATVVADKDGNILQKVRKPTESEKGPRHAVQLLLRMVDEVLDLAGLRRERCFRDWRQLRRSPRHENRHYLFSAKSAGVGCATVERDDRVGVSYSDGH